MSLSSHNNRPKKLPVIALDEILATNSRRRPRPTATTRATWTTSSDVDPVMGITTASTMQLPFEILDKSDPIFQTTNETQQSTQDDDCQEGQTKRQPTMEFLNEVDIGEVDLDESYLYIWGEETDEISRSAQASVPHPTQHRNIFEKDNAQNHEASAMAQTEPLTQTRDSASTEIEVVREPSRATSSFALSRTQLNDPFHLPLGEVSADVDPSIQRVNQDDKGQRPTETGGVPTETAVNCTNRSIAPEKPESTGHGFTWSFNETIGLSQADQGLGSDSLVSERDEKVTAPVELRTQLRTVRSHEQANQTSVSVGEKEQTLLSPASGDDAKSDEKETPLLQASHSNSIESDEAQFKAIMEKIDGDIFRCEETALFEMVELSISAAEAAVQRGGRAQCASNVLNGSLIEGDCAVFKGLLYDGAQGAAERRSEECTEQSGEAFSGVLESEDCSRVVLHKARLPKYAGDTKKRLLSRRRLQETVVDAILAKEGKTRPNPKIAVRLDDDPCDLFSVILRCQGYPRLVELVENRVAMLIKAYQQRLAQEDSDSDIKVVKNPNEIRRKDVVVVHNDSRKHSVKRKRGSDNFRIAYNRVSEIENASSGFGMKHVSSCMRAQHEHKDGEGCGAKCECPRDLNYLSKTAVGSFFDKEFEKDHWKKEIPLVGFVYPFASKFLPMLQTEFSDEASEQILSRLVLMWSEHKKIPRFGLECRESCPCSEGWELVFKKGHLHAGERDAETARRAQQSSTTCPAPSTPVASVPRSFRRGSVTKSGAWAAAPKEQLWPGGARYAKDVAESVKGTRVLKSQACSISSEPAVCSAPRANQSMDTKDLIDAVQYHGIGDVVASLQAGANPNTKDRHGMTAKEYVKRRLDALNSQSQEGYDHEIQSQRTDFELKRKVLSLFISALYCIDLARFNKHWKRYKYRVDVITGLRLSIGGEDHEGSMDCQVTVNDEKKKPVLLVPSDQESDEWTNACPDFNTLDYNLKLMTEWPQERQEIVVSLLKVGKARGSLKPLLLGRVVIPFSRVVAAAQKEKGRIKEELTTHELLSGTITITAEEDKESTVQVEMAQQAVSKLKKAIDFIGRFNDEKDADWNMVPKLSASSVMHSGVSLLHAAIYLKEPNLLKQLLTLGTPQNVQVIVSARLLASNLLGDREDDKEAREILRLLKILPSNSHNGCIRDTQQGSSLDAAPSNTLSEFDDIADPCEKGPHVDSPVTSARSYSDPSRAGLSSNAQSASASVSLPLLDFWYLPGQKRCRFFNNSSSKCRYGRDCRYLHVNPPIGRRLDEFLIPPDVVDWRREYLRIRRQTDQNGRLFYAAAYRNPADNVLYEAERGHGAAGQNRHGLYWYDTEQDAVDALKRVVAFCQAERDQGKKRHSQQEFVDKAPKRLCF